MTNPLTFLRAVKILRFMIEEGDPVTELDVHVCLLMRKKHVATAISWLLDHDLVAVKHLDTGGFVYSIKNHVVARGE